MNTKGKGAPMARCDTCGNEYERSFGHGVQTDEQMFCSAHCARQRGVRGITDHVGSHVVIAR
jgi:hypothetical protein